MAELLTWDWKEQPDWSEFAAALRKLGARVRLYEVDTQSDQFALVLSNEDLTEADLAELWRPGSVGGGS